ncbi:hypothetical protein OG802_10465 [Streptomyces sp. NBC_00704]|uniref:hypothetical protein n=1 Tax=Streptomyces sp. NBC_00704 TaxID=2975809 RepID=UPI002E31EB71|nr:hypothetical protein [Streptomyces sp. NBC_00704]
MNELPKLTGEHERRVLHFLPATGCWGDDGDGGLVSASEMYVHREVHCAGQAHDDRDGRQLGDRLDAFDVIDVDMHALGWVGHAQAQLLTPVVNSHVQRQGQAGSEVALGGGFML